ncbi:MAG: hypothetical protein C0605_15265 [Hyphomicrobiales bacterium]|nr:MAG: hypothetical protein C0605_15265 [Hyphomicrobiales bacterium]
MIVGVLNQRGNKSPDENVASVMPRAWLARLAACGLVAAASMALAPLAAEAATTERPKVKIVKVKKGSKVLFESDRMTYHRRRNVVVALGNVQLYYGPYALRADRIQWDRNRDEVIARGNVTFRDATGNLVSAPYAILVDEFREGFLRSVEVIFTNDAKLAARTAERHDGNITILNKAVYSPCKVCEDNPEKAPLWQIKSVKVTHDQAAKTVYYRHAWFEFFGQPVAYLPYFSHPDPSVKRRSGFLLPRFRYSEHYGGGVTTPYFWNIAPNKDITFSPTFTTRHGPLLDMEWRHRTRTGAYMIKPTGIHEFNFYGDDTGVRKWRGSIETHGKFELNRNWNWGWNGWLVSDDTFLSKYGLSSASDLISNVHLTGVSGRNYFNGEVIHFRGLLSTDSQSTTPLVHPVIDSSIIFDDPVMGGTLGLDSNLLSMTRETGADVHRASTNLHWSRTITDGLGQQFTPFVSLRGDIYSTSHLTATSGTDNVARVMPAIGLEYRWAFARMHDWGGETFTPIAQIIARPNETRMTRISNEDAQTVEFDTLNLFSKDKFHGLDRMEGGVRANMGFLYRLDHNSGAFADLVFGQSFHLAGRNSFGVDTGLEHRRSDYVASLTLSPFSWLSMSSRLRVDPKKLKLNKHEFDLTASSSWLWTSLQYTRLAAQPALGSTAIREEISAYSKLKLHENWSVLGSMRYDIGNKEPVEESLGLSYEDECFLTTFKVENTYRRDRDLSKDLKISLAVTLKTLGESSVGTTANRVK